MLFQRQLLNMKVGGIEPTKTVSGQQDALFVRLQGFFKAGVVVLQLLDEGFEPLQGLFERKIVGQGDGSGVGHDSRRFSVPKVCKKKRRAGRKSLGRYEF